MAEQYGVSRMTAGKVLGLLAAEGLIRRRRGVGSVVARQIGWEHILVEPGTGPPITTTATGGLTLTVPREAGRDPEAALTPEQRAMIGTEDRLIIVCYTDDWRGRGADPSGKGEGP